MRKLICFLCLLLCLAPAAALADTDLTVTPHEAGFDYEITTDETWVRLVWSGKAGKGVKTLYLPDGHGQGAIELPYTPAGGRYTISVQNLNVATVAKRTVTVPPAADYTAPKGKSNAKITDFVLTETAEGFKYSFVAEGTDFVMLYFRSKQDETSFPVYPVNDEGLYEGEVISPLTYARTLFIVEVRSGAGKVLKKGEVRKAFETPAAPEKQEGRLSGLVVCIDPGHQEKSEPFREPLGPGLSGTVTNTGGMAQGKTTLRRESIVVLETGILLRDMLLREGATVVMTRDVQDLFHTNIERCEIAENAGAHIMLRLHCDSNSNTKKSGLSVYAPLNSDYARAVADKDEYRRLGQAFIDEMKKAVGYELTDKTGMVYLNNNYVGNNWAKMVCFLVEMGYMTNSGEDIKMAAPEYQAMLAEGMVEGLYQVALMRGWLEE